MTERDSHDFILTQWDQRLGVYSDLANKLKSLLEEILLDGSVQLHSITSRRKERSSLSAKLHKPDKNYLDLAEVTDLAAARITTYFAEDVDAIARIVEKEFAIDRENSVDKRNLDPERFGYKSLHYVASLSVGRLGFSEYSRFSGLKFEIQIRSILQHAWAEIEHDLGYKSAAGVPRELRRRFSRIAGLLELADDEFAAIRERLLSYENSVDRKISHKPETVGIDKLSLRALVSNSQSTVRKLSEAIASATGASVTPASGNVLENSSGMLSMIPIETIADLETLATSHFDISLKFAKEFLRMEKHKVLNDAIGILYLWYVLICERFNEGRISTCLAAAHMPDAFFLSKRLASTFKRIRE